MAQSKLLVDTNSYLRLAQSIHPLLASAFGAPPYCLYCIPEVHAELQRSRRLRTTFPWALSTQYVANRQRFPNVSRAQTKEIAITFGILEGYAAVNGLGPSPVDIKVLAYANELAIPVVTDDNPMRQLAADFSIQTMSTLDLLKLMENEQHIDRARVRAIASYWMNQGDWPGNFTADYRRLFDEELPSG